MYYSKFIEEVTPFFLEENFIFDKSIKGFVQNFSDGQKRFYVTLDRVIQVRLGYGIKFSIIDKIFSGIFEISDKKNYNTIFVNLLNTLDDDESNFFITNPAEIRLGVEKTIRIFKDYASRYFDDYKSLKDIDRLLNDEDVYYNKIGNNKYHGDIVESITKGLIVAKVLNRSDYDSIEQQRLDSLSENLHPDLYSESKDKILKVREYFNENALRLGKL